MSAASTVARTGFSRAAAGGSARFLAAVGVSCYGDWLTTVALVVLLYRVTGTAAAPALYILARVAPRVAGPLFGGTLTDRVGPVRVATLCALAQGCLTGMIVLLAASRAVWGIYLLVAAAQFLNALSQPALGALLPRVTPAHRLGRVNGIYSGLFSSSILVSPALGALLLPHVSPEWLIAADAATFLVAALLLLTLDGVAPPVPSASPRGAAAGFRIVSRDRVLRLVAAAYAANPAVITALQAVLVIAASQRFGHDSYVGWLYAAVGAGGLIGSLSFLRPTPSQVGRRAILVASVIELGPLAVFVVAPNLAVAAALLFISSMGGVLWQVNGSIGLQQRVPVDLLGRVNAAVRSAMYTGMLVGAVAVAVLVQPFGWQATVLCVVAAAFLLIAAAALTRPRRLASHPAALIPD
ncbi:MAG: MFS transporter [Candidatus Dormibacteraeota bacterium]|nr:MFS transporter [Candidatus Dormibacteraeota bacterium]